MPALLLAAALAQAAPSTTLQLEVRQADGPRFFATPAGLAAAPAGGGEPDPLDLRDGAPRGRPLALRFDGEGRLWVLTARVLGVVDPGWLFGATVPATRPGPWTSWHWSGDDRVTLVGPRRRYTHLIDREPPPRFEVLAVQGHPFEEGKVYRCGRDGLARLRLRIAAGEAGGARIRWRPADRHLWRPLSPRQGQAVVGPFRPGRRRLVLAIWSADLRRGRTLAIPLDVPPPPGYGRRELLGLLTGGLVLVLVACLVAGRRRRAPGPWLGRSLIRAGGLSLILLQVTAALFPHARGWPFVGFTMYTETYGEGALIYRPVIEGIFAGGIRRALHPTEGGISVPFTSYRAIVPLVHGGPEALAAFVARYRATHPPTPRLVGLRILQARTRLTADGPKPVASLVVARYAETR